MIANAPMYTAARALWPHLSYFPRSMMFSNLVRALVSARAEASAVPRRVSLTSGHLLRPSRLELIHKLDRLAHGDVAISAQKDGLLGACFHQLPHPLLEHILGDRLSANKHESILPIT